MKFAILFSALFALVLAGPVYRRSTDSAVISSILQRLDDTDEAINSLKTKTDNAIAQFGLKYATKMVSGLRNAVNAKGEKVVSIAEDAIEKIQTAIAVAKELDSIEKIRGFASTMIGVLAFDFAKLVMIGDEKLEGARRVAHKHVVEAMASLGEMVSNLLKTSSNIGDSVLKYFEKLLEGVLSVVAVHPGDEKKDDTRVRREVTISGFENREQAIEFLQKLVAHYEELVDKSRGFFRTMYEMALSTIKSTLAALQREADREANGADTTGTATVENARASVEQLEDILANIDTRGAVDTVVSGIELVKMIVFRTRQMVASIEDVARHMEEQGYKDVADNLRKMSAAMVEAKAKLTELISRLPIEKREKIASVLNTGLNVVETSLNYIDKLGIIKGTKDASTIVSGIKSLVDAFNGQEPVEGDQKNLEEILKVPGVPQLVKACRAFLKFASRLLKAAGQSQSTAQEYIKQTVDIIDATMAVYKEAVESATTTSQMTWSETATSIKDRFLGLFRSNKA